MLPLKPRRPVYFWNKRKRSMTLCIAAICEDVEGTEPKIVLCTDMQRETEGIGSSETEEKLGFVRSGWPVLLAGTITRANELINRYAGYLSKHYSEIDEFNLLDHLRRPAHRQKAKLVDDYLRQTFAFGRTYFYKHGRERFPESFVSTQEDVISKIKLDASLIIAGFITESDFSDSTKNARPFLCVVDDMRQDEVLLEFEYDAIGSGHGTSLSTLYRREQDSINSLGQTLYNVYEANSLSDKVPGVGRNYVNIDILYADGNLKTLSEEGYKYLKHQFKKKFGPKKISSGAIEFRPEFVEPFTQEKSKTSDAQAI